MPLWIVCLVTFKKIHKNHILGSEFSKALPSHMHNEQLASQCPLETQPQPYSGILSTLLHSHYGREYYLADLRTSPCPAWLGSSQLCFGISFVEPVDLQLDCRRYTHDHLQCNNSIIISRGTETVIISSEHYWSNKWLETITTIYGTQ